ncbi:unnamed protein product [Adineta ricciae]|uniref:Uncharacterized protein n=1 Tax=Adineta ricciae TaxID=249248 RepID=A0A813ZW37_ADIRI|nr:unnamed protein product [Adineta ricciae]CAF1091166.1 unnamed protein product [Adineta ricciae]
MHLVYRAIILTTFLALYIECQGGGGAAGGGGSSGGSFIYNGGSDSSCTGSDCSLITTVVFSIVGGIFALFVLIFGISYCVKRYRGLPRQTNALFVENQMSKTNCEHQKCDLSIFKCGFWKSHYFQYGKWHGPCRFSLKFIDNSKTITGEGSDDVGKFTIRGVYSDQTGRLGLTKTYKKGTGNSSENLGHQVTIQLTWNQLNNRFEGTWYVQTSKYHGEDKFQLTFDAPHLSTVYGKV